MTTELNNGNVSLDPTPDHAGWFTIIDQNGLPFAKVRSKIWAESLIKVINNRGSEPEDDRQV